MNGECKCGLNRSTCYDQARVAVAQCLRFSKISTGFILFPDYKWLGLASGGLDTDYFSY